MSEFDKHFEEIYSINSADKDHDFMKFIPWKDNLIYIKDNGADASLRTLVDKVVVSVPLVAFFCLSLINATNELIYYTISVFDKKNVIKA